MTVKEQLKTDMLKFPMMMKNKWSCYHQWFSVVGNGLEWVNGELIDTVEKETPYLDVNKALDDAFESFLSDEIDNSRDYTSDVYECGCDDSLILDVMSDNFKTMTRETNIFKDRVKLIVNVESRMNDLTQSEEFYPLTENCILCTLPEEGVNEDWKNACREFYGWIKDNYDSMDFETKMNFDKIKTSWLVN